MGVYVNPGNASFQRIAGPKYVDKTGDELLELQLGNEPELFGCYTTPDHVSYVGVLGVNKVGMESQMKISKEDTMRVWII